MSGESIKKDPNTSTHSQSITGVIENFKHA